MKKSFINILLAALFATVSCSVLEQDSSVFIPDTVKKDVPKVPIEFNISVPADPATKAMNELPEIKNVILIVFSDAGYFNEWVIADKQTVMATQNDVECKLTAKLSMSEGTRLRVHVIANCPSDLVNNPPITGTSNLDIEDAVMSRICSRLGDTYKPNPESNNTFNIEDGYWQKIILPFGIAAEKEENGNSSDATYKKDANGNLIPTDLTKNQFTMLSPIPLIRNFARIQLVNHAENFVIEKIGLAYAPAKGVIAPILNSPYYVDRWGARVQVNFAEGTEDENGYHDGAATAYLIQDDNTRVPDGMNVVKSLHLLGHELKDPDTGEDLLGAQVDKFYDELFVTNYHNLPLEDPKPDDEDYAVKRTWRLLSDAPYNYGGYNTSPLEFAPNPSSDSDLQDYDPDAFIYVYERPKPRFVSGRAENATRMIIKGHFEGESSSKYYPVDIVDKHGSYSALLRNHTYYVVLNGVAPDAGETDITKAPDSTGSNVSDDHRTSDLNEVSDGRASIIVSFIDITHIKSGSYSVMYRYIPDIKSNSPEQDNASVGIRVGYDGTSAGFVENTQSSTGATFASVGTPAKPNVSIELDGNNNPKLYVQSGNNWIEAQTTAEKAMAWSKINYTTVSGGENDLFTYPSSGTIRVEGGRGLHRDVRVNITPIKDMVVECGNKYVESNEGEQETLIIRLPNDLTRSMFPLELKIEPEVQTLNPASGENLPVTSGGSIVQTGSREGESSYYFIKTVTRQEYEAIEEDEDKMKAVECSFKTVTAASATRIWVANQYFKTKSDDFFNYKKRQFDDLAFGSYKYGNKDITFEFNFDKATNAAAYWDNNTEITNPESYRILPRQVTLNLTNLTMKTDGNGYADAGIQKKGNTNNFILNVASYLGDPSGTYNNNKITLHMRVLNDSQDVGVNLTTEDLLAEPEGFVPNTGLYTPANATKSTSTFELCSISDMHWESASGETITQVLTGTDRVVYFCFNYENENLQPVTFKLTNLTRMDNTVSQDGDTFTFTPAANSGNAQRIALKTSGNANQAAQLRELQVTTQYNMPATRNFTLSRFANYTLAISPANPSVIVDNTTTLTATVGPAGAPGTSNATITWTSLDEDKATVNSNGVVTGIARGSARIQASTTIDGNTVSAQTTVTVKARVWHAASYTLSFTSNANGNAASFTTSPQNVTFENFERGGTNNNNRYKSMGARNLTLSGWNYSSGIITITAPSGQNYTDSVIIGVTMTYTGNNYDNNPVSYKGDNAALSGGSQGSWGTTTTSTAEVTGYQTLVVTHACTNSDQYDSRNRLTGMTVYYGYYVIE